MAKNKNLSKEVKEAIVNASKSGSSGRQIAKIFNVNRRTVDRIVKRFKEEKTVDRRKASKRSPA